MVASAVAMETAVPLPTRAEGVEGEETTASFEALLRRHGAALYRTAYRLAGNESDAEDLLQDTVIEGLRAFRSFRPGSHFDRWMRAIMSHTFIDRVRRRRRSPTISLDVAERLPAPPDIIPEEALLRSEEQAAVREALAALPAEFRLAVVLVDIEGLAYEEAAAMMHCALGTVRSRLHRGRQLLRARLTGVLRR